MLSTAADLVQLATAAPWAAVGFVALVAAAWVYRQSRRAVAEARADAAASAARQGRRLGVLEQLAREERTRRRQTEAWLREHGARLPLWPPDGPADDDAGGAFYDDEDTGDAGDAGDYAGTRAYPSVPPLPDFARHRR